MSSSAATAPSVRRVLPLVAPALFLEGSMFTVLAPLLPHYEDELGLGPAATGLLSAAFPAGALLFALPAGALAARLGGKRAMLLGLTLLSLASVAFGLAPGAALLDAARFLQGCGAAVIGAAGLTWVAAVAPAHQRATALGTLLGLAPAGALLGPPLGALAVALSPALLFGLIPLIAACLALGMARLPDGAPPRPERSSPLALTARSVRGEAAWSMWLVLLPATALGLVYYLGPLRLDALGASAALIAVVFVAAGGTEALLNPLLGRTADRRGVRWPVLLGLPLMAAPIALLGSLGTLPALAAALIVGAAASACFWPAGSVRLHRLVERAGVGDGHAFALFNLCWAGGQIVGSAGAGALSSFSSAAVPCVVTAAAMVATALVLARRPA
jgi:predicted MFS family arabinose efflux permease